MSRAFEEARKSMNEEASLASRSLYVFLKGVAKVAFFLFFRVYAKNSKALPKKGRVIVAPTHRSNLDVPLISATCRRKLYFLAKGSLFVKKFWAWALPGMGGIPLDRSSRADKLALDASLAALRNGRALTVFPEGERKAGPSIFPILDGAVWLAAKADAPILPVGIGGSERAMPKGKFFPTPRRVVILYGELIPPPQPLPGERRVSRTALSEYSDNLHGVLQDLFDRAQILAGSPYP